MSDDEEEFKDKQIGDYLLNEELGSGGFGKVVLGTHIPTGEKVAIKIMDKEQILSDELNKVRVLNEISILKIVRHNNIIKLYEVMETPQKIYLVMEYCDSGEMFDYIVAKQHLTENQACVFFLNLQTYRFWYKSYLYFRQINNNAMWNGFICSTRNAQGGRILWTIIRCLECRSFTLCYGIWISSVL